jgi:hypothetical protein
MRETMTANHLYDLTSLMCYQMSILSLAAALDQRDPAGPGASSQGALFEAEKLKETVDRLAL